MRNMRKLFIAASAIWLTSSAAASAQVLIWKAPAQYDHAYRGRVVVHQLTWQAARSLCDRVVPSYMTLSGTRSRPDACQWFAGRVCHIAIPVGSDVTAVETMEYRRHETAHCNGWSDSHAGGA
jgi:hypothetical protein